MTGNQHIPNPASPHQSDSYIDNQQFWLKAIKHWAETPTLQHRAEKKQDSWLKYVTRRLMLDSDIKNVHIRPQQTTIWGHVDKKTPPVHFCSPHNVEDCPKCQKYQNMPKMDVQFLKSVTILDSDGKSAHFQACQPLTHWQPTMLTESDTILGWDHDSTT